jgi:hypothetical protein
MSISIPPFSNVPAPGDPIQSAWAQQITQYVVDLQTATARRPLGLLGSAGTSGSQGLGVAFGTLSGTTVNFTVTGTGRSILLLAQCSIDKGANPQSDTILQIAASFGDPLVTAKHIGIQDGFAQIVTFRHIAVAAGAHSAWLKAATESGFANAVDRTLLVYDLGGTT